jgi:hypothetical protein
MARENNPSFTIEPVDERHLLLTVRFGEMLWQHKFRTLSAAKTAAAKRMTVERKPELRTQTLREFEVEWQRDYLLRECADDTRRDYETCFRRLVLPRLGDRPLDQISRSVVDVFMDDLYVEGRCWTVQRGRRTLSAMLGVAKSWGYIESNPVTRRR